MAHFYKRYQSVDDGVLWTPELRLGAATEDQSVPGILVGEAQTSEEDCDAILAAIRDDLALEVVRDIGAPVEEIGPGPRAK